MATIPLLLVGDGPQEPTGLGRIARDLGRLVVESDLPVDVVQVGGVIPPTWQAWRHLPLTTADRDEDWGARYVRDLWHDLWGVRPGVLWTVGWDPARLYPYASIDLPVQKWAYPAIDSCNVQGGLSGPPAAAIEAFDRVVAYGRWASQVVRTAREGPVPYLPHGIDTATFGEPAQEEEQAWVRARLGAYCTEGTAVIGCVATNQARKDLALYCETLSTLLAREHRVYGWLHTDTLTGAWSIDHLVHDYVLARRLTVTLGTLTDRQLACLYQRCSVTIAPGLGEGFGYPIAESLAAGTPVVHGDFGGGVELVPKIEWRFPVRERRRESIYALTRPVYRAEDVANAIERVWRWQETVGEKTSAAYCRGAVAHLDWLALRGRWMAWLKEGLA